jgi:hypothetical protein
MSRPQWHKPARDYWVFTEYGLVLCSSSLVLQRVSMEGNEPLHAFLLEGPSRAMRMRDAARTVADAVGKLLEDYDKGKDLN